jgi:hypothetical protein
MADRVITLADGRVESIQENATKIPVQDIRW